MKRFVVIEPRPRALVDQEFVQPRLARRRLVADQRVSIASLPAHTCSRNSASITCAARTMCASASRSFAGSAEMSAVRSVGANRADLLQLCGCFIDGWCRRCCGWCGRRLSATSSQGCDQRRRRYSHTDTPIQTALSSMNAGRALQHRGSAPRRRIAVSHIVGRGLEDQVGLHGCEEPRAFRELDVELSGAPAGATPPPCA